MLTDYQGLQERVAEKRPLLMLDRAAILEPGQKVQAVKLVSMDEEFFQGHFPNAPIMPGVLQVAAMSQAAALLLPPPPGAYFLPWLAGVQKIKFRKPVLPGDLLVVDATFVSHDPVTGESVFSAATSVDGEVTCQGLVRLAWKPRAAFARKPEALMPARHDYGVAAPAGAMKTEEIMKIVPHRYPFLLIDRIVHADPVTQRMVGIKNVTGNEPFMAGLPVPFTPGYLQVEMCAQVGCVLALSLPENQGKLGFFMAVDDAKFHAPVVPGDQLLIDTISNLRSRFGKGEAKIYVGDQLMTEVQIKFAIVDREVPAAANAAGGVA